MLRNFQRFLTIQALMLWQGGFLFYASFVVPVGTEFLGSALEQAQITRKVTISLNILGGIGLAILLWDYLNHRFGPGNRFRLFLWIIMVLMQIGMCYLHPIMEGMMDEEYGKIRRMEFRPYHRIYLWLSTIQWFAALLYAIWMVRSWNRVTSSASS